MSTLRQAGRALQAGIGLAVAAGLAIFAGCAQTEAIDASGPAGEGSTAEVAQAFLVECTNAGGTVAGALNVNISPNGTYCYRTSVINSGSNPPVPVDPNLPSCWQLAKHMGCIGF